MTRSPDHPITRSSRLRVLYIAYPLLTVSEESAGGAEQMLWTLEREMAHRGVQATVAASAGSRVSGELFSTGPACTQPDDFERRNREHQDRIVEFVRRRAREGRSFDLIHDKSGSFWPRAAEINAPVLATLHLPRTFYSPRLFENIPASVSFNCVSESQASSFSDLKQLIGVVPNGIALDRFQPGQGPRSGLLWLGRICEEKAPHLALEIATRAGEAITMAGQVYPFSYHQQYFDREVAPRLSAMSNATWIESPSAEMKRKLLREARAVLITSLVDETSSLVAMEAAASGTPVIAFCRGALAEIVHDGVTGFLVESVEEALLALRRIEQIIPADCARHAWQDFSSSGMAERYILLYVRLMKRAHSLTVL
jgi:glycosyltransferase involved in cell wall biosynthesis